MPSPFPGMDPYVEALGRWPSFHASFIARCADALNEALPENYIATIDERVQLESGGDEAGASIAAPAVKRLGPDVAISHSGSPGDRRGARSAAATLEPHPVRNLVDWLDEPTQKYIEVLGLPDHRLVTTIELLSPSNKRAGKDRTAYLAKRRDLLHRSISLVEIDLLLRGDRLPMLEPLPDGDYYAFVTRGDAPERCDVYAWEVRRPLPAIPVPLKSDDREVELNLASSFAETYDRGRYRALLRYDAPPQLPLRAEDQTWVIETAAKSR